MVSRRASGSGAAREGQGTAIVARTEVAWTFPSRDGNRVRTGGERVVGLGVVVADERVWLRFDVDVVRRQAVTR